MRRPGSGRLALAQAAARWGRGVARTVGARLGEDGMGWAEELAEGMESKQSGILPGFRASAIHVMTHTTRAEFAASAARTLPAPASRCRLIAVPLASQQRDGTEIGQHAYVGPTVAMAART